MNLAFFASYNGSSAHAITDACLSGDIIASPVLLITNNAKAGALTWSENKGLKSFTVNAKTCDNSQDIDSIIAQKLKDHKIDWVCCSGYMCLIGPKTIQAVQGKILNIHPALLPQYGGKGMYGDHVHQAIKQAGETETGATIHLVNEEYDEGKILTQKIIAIDPQDSAKDIASKVRAIEPQFYVETIRKILKGEITIS